MQKYNRIVLLFFIIILMGCSKTKKHTFTNNLIKETSPYLLQHAHNPVNWYAWNDETLALAKKENKLLLISVGYASCHWCHVMEHESFEDEEIAKIMNTHFINIKVDREERPDVDQIYINAVQLMTGQVAGWPLNCIALPDGRPVWGGTYFSKNNWAVAIQQIADLYKQDSLKMAEYAEKVKEGIKQSNLISFHDKASDFSSDFIDRCVNNWSSNFDKDWGGMNSAPKFPMPNNYYYLMRYAHQTNNQPLSEFVETTLTQMAQGGIFDQIGGGFARYSTDTKWHIPHFEKMLYDNGQLVSLYSDAYLVFKNELFKETVYNTLLFIEREFTNKNGGFYASLDADSFNEKNEMEEGAFYVWGKKALEKIVDSNFDLFCEYFNINSYGYWENNKYHLIRTTSDEDFAKKHNIEIDVLKKKVQDWKNVLLKERSKKPKPRLDDKILTSWNALMLKGYVDAYRVFDDEKFLTIALKNASFLADNIIKENGGLYRNYKNGKATINGYLEDYATLIEAYIALYEVSLDEKWMKISKQLTDYTFDHFFDIESKMFFFTSNEDSLLIVRRIETEDNVISASNSIMAKNLQKIGHFYENSYYLKVSRQMVQNVIPSIEKYTSAYSNWLDVYTNYSANFYEVAILGKNAEEKVKELNKVYIPNKIIAASTIKNTLPLLKNRYVEGETILYVCENNTCNLPTSKTKIALQQLSQ